MEKVRLGFVGCGVMGQLVHLPILVELNRCELVALAELRPQLGEEVARKFGIPKLYRSHTELVEDAAVDAVVAVTADDYHAPIAIDLLRAGKHVLIEKPLTTNVADGEQMVLTAERTGAMLMVNFMRRFDPGVELAKRWIDELRVSGEIGEITSARCHHFGNDWYCNIGEPIITEEPYPEIARTAPPWLPDHLVNLFRHINNVYSHNLDLLSYLLGEVTAVEFAHVEATQGIESDPRFGSGRTMPVGASRTPSSSQTQLIAVLRFEEVHATISAGSGSGDFWDEETVVYFRDGWVSIRTPPPLLRNVAAQVEVSRANGQRKIISARPPLEWSFRRADEHFLDCIIKGEQSRSSGKNALATLKVFEQIFASQIGPRGAGRGNA